MRQCMRSARCWRISCAEGRERSPIGFERTRISSECGVSRPMSGGNPVRQKSDLTPANTALEPAARISSYERSDERARRGSTRTLARNLNAIRSVCYTQNDLMTPEFEWDAEKAADNLKNHGVGFGEALTVFADPLANIFEDPDHSADERRELIIGHSTAQRILVVSFTELGRRIRIISARRVTPSERKDYEQNKPKGSTT